VDECEREPRLSDPREGVAATLVGRRKVGIAAYRSEPQRAAGIFVSAVRVALVRFAPLAAAWLERDFWPVGIELDCLAGNKRPRGQYPLVPVLAFLVITLPDGAITSHRPPLRLIAWPRAAPGEVSAT
jgi:hypothetical protein